MSVSQSTTILGYQLNMKESSVGNHHESLKQFESNYVHIILTFIVPRQIKSRIKENICVDLFQNIHYFGIYWHISFLTLATDGGE
jgi:hypothetical protein